MVRWGLPAGHLLETTLVFLTMAENNENRFLSERGTRDMMTAVNGYYNGNRIVMDEDIPLRKGQRVIITLLEPLAEQPKRDIDLRKYMGRGQKMFYGDADAYVKELRSSDRV